MSKPKAMVRAANHPKTIVFLAAPNTQILDVAGPFQVFVRAAELFVHDYPSQKRPYNVVLASSTDRKAVTTNCGLVLPELRLSAASEGQSTPCSSLVGPA
jgi:transcriptional regulator GlxA family with amidase domain